ncbi:MAG TPA: RNA polymerase sigma factor [Candidatus Dormibacteraeota bacterium]|nr:RNA polymerase sigma factor [Candidatus Dormibacteraeota bacterium]
MRAATGGAVGALFRDDDVGLLQAYRRGDVRGFERLFARHHDRLRALAVRYLRDPVEADDVLQETFLRLLRIADTVDDGFNVMAWLHRVAANICLTQLRSARRVQLVDNDSEPMRAEEDSRRTGQPEAAYEMTHAREVFGRVARRLPEQQRICLVLREVEGLSYRDIANRLSVSAGSIESLLFRARRRFRDEYLRLEGEEPSRCAMTRHLLEVIGRSQLGSRGERVVAQHLNECAACRRRVAERHRPRRRRAAASS